MVKKDQEWRLLDKAYRLVDAKHEYALGMKGAMRWLLDKSSSGDLELRHEGDPTGEQVRYLLTEYAADPGIALSILATRAQCRVDQLYKLLPRANRGKAKNKGGRPRHQATDTLLLAAGAWLNQNGEPKERARLEGHLKEVAQARGFTIGDTTIADLAKLGLKLWRPDLAGN